MPPPFRIPRSLPRALQRPRLRPMPPLLLILLGLPRAPQRPHPRTRPVKCRPRPDHHPLTSGTTKFVPLSRARRPRPVSPTIRASGCTQTTTVGFGSRAIRRQFLPTIALTLTSIRRTSAGPGTSRPGATVPIPAARGPSARQSGWPSGLSIAAIGSSIMTDPRLPRAGEDRTLSVPNSPVQRRRTTKQHLPARGARSQLRAGAGADRLSVRGWWSRGGSNP